ncbi:MAG: hypothetical protein ACYTJ0_19220, partial [Planctomycetota bacterium]
MDDVRAGTADAPCLELNRRRDDRPPPIAHHHGDETTAAVDDAAPAPAPGLTPEQLEALHSARRRGRAVSRAAIVAAISGWTLAVFAFITLLSGIFSLPALLLGIGMSIAAWVELRGARGLRRLDLCAPRQLGCNQLCLAAMLCLYGGWGIISTITGPGPYDHHLAQGG